MSTAASSSTPTVIAQRYELQRQLAQGGMAEVWLAVDLTLDRKVAVKWLKPNLATDQVVTERFRREAIAAASLNHPNIVAVHDVFAQDGRQAVVMQLVEGKSLRQLLDTQKRLSPELTCHIGTCVALALDHAHEAGFVHRDVKPGNIMITSDGRVLLTDFGIAKGLQSPDADLTSDNIMMGTAKYLSPEQVRGKKLDGRADLYSLGLVLYECLAGRVPFLGETDADTALARLQRDPTDLARLRATLPTALVTIIHRLLARNPANRPASGAELVEALRAAVAEGPPVVDDTTDERSPIVPFGRRFRRAPSDELERPRPESKPRAPAAASRWPMAKSAPAAAHATTTNPTISPTDGRQPERRQPGRHRPDHRQRGHDVDGRRHSGRGDAQRAACPCGRPRRPTSDRRYRCARHDSRHRHTASRAPIPPTAAGLSNSWKPSMLVVAVLLVIALLVGGLLWFNLQYGGGETAATTTVLPASDTVAPTDPVTGAVVAPDPAADPRPAAQPIGPATITAVAAFDPDGDNVENDADTALALADGDATTSWATSCYESQYMGGKRGVGLVVSFDQLTQQALTVDVINAPYQLQFFAVADEVAPTDLARGVRPSARSSSPANPATVTSGTPPVPVRHMLVLLNEIGREDSCTDAHPYRGRLGEIALVG